MPVRCGAALLHGARQIGCAAVRVEHGGMRPRLK